MARIRINRLKQLLFGNKQLIVNADRQGELLLLQARNRAVDDMIETMQDHPVSQEISAGPKAFNSSGTLGGVGNLFSFIGFVNGSNPIGELEQTLRQSIGPITRDRRFRKNGIFLFKQPKPDREFILSKTPFPWATGRSWVQGIEQGISGFGEYLYFAREDAASRRAAKYSRSGSAIQIRRPFRAGGFKKTSYLSKIITSFEQSFRSNVKRAG